MSIEEFKKITDTYFEQMPSGYMLERFGKLGYQFDDLKSKEISMKKTGLKAKRVRTLSWSADRFHFSKDHFSYTLIHAA